MFVLLACLLLAFGLLYASQRRLIYFPSRLSATEFADSVKRTLGDRVSILAPFDAIVFEPPSDTAVAGTAIWFHGNAGLGLDRAKFAPVFTRRGFRFILAEYPGYGARTGLPTETSLVDDADALYRKVSLDHGDAPVLLLGESLGTGVAVQVAARQATRSPARLVLLTPFLSLSETAARAYRYLPVRYLVKDRFDSAGALGRYAGPVAILVAGQDGVVGATQGRVLAQLSRSRGPTCYLEIPEAGHNSWAALITDAQWTELLGVPSVPDETEARSA